ncbi:MAG: NBR1-Ig-like domain-containing protein [Anaerolineales bacterium]
MNWKTKSRWSILPVFLGALLLTACGAGGEEPTPTLTMEEIQTQAVSTFAADMTSTALAMPTETPTPTESPTATATATPAGTSTPAATATLAGAQPTDSCYGMRFVSDVTVPDNTEMDPGEEFTKTWQVRNSGSCAWESGFTFRFIGGESMGGSTVTLQDTVQPGNEREFSVDMTAPSTAGTYRGNWRMATAGDVVFGDEVYVLIEVGDAQATATTGPTATSPPATATTAPTATPTETQ